MQTLVCLLLGEALRGSVCSRFRISSRSPAWRSAFLPGRWLFALWCFCADSRKNLQLNLVVLSADFGLVAVVYTQLLSLLFRFESCHPFIPTLLPFPLFFLCFWLLFLVYFFEQWTIFDSTIWVLKSVLKLILKWSTLSLVGHWEMFMQIHSKC